MLILSEADLRRTLRMPEVIVAVERGFQMMAGDAALTPERLQLNIPAKRATLLEMPAYARSESENPWSALGTKIASVFPENPALGLDLVQAVYLFLDGDTGKPLALMEGKFLTSIRTAATSAVATKHLAGSGKKRLAIFGAGAQARFHIEAMLALVDVEVDVEEVLICSRTAATAEALAESVRSTHRIPSRVVSAEEATARANLICTCTSASAPLFDGALLQPGTHLNTVGAFKPTARELDTETVRRARVFIDAESAAGREAGEIVIPLAEGSISASHIKGTLDEVVSGKISGRTSPDEITLFKSCGLAIEDLVTARLAYESAVAENLGVQVDF